MEKKKMTKMSFRFDEEYRKLLEEISKLERRSMTDELRLLIDERAAALGLEPVNPVKKVSDA